MSTTRTVTLALTGASGMPYGLRLLECLLAAGTTVGLVYSPAAQIVAKQECDLVFPSQPREAARWFAERYRAKPGQLAVYGRDDWMAPIASGSAPADAMAVCPCTMGTLGAIANGLADNLIERAADVALKERRPLVLVPRETPLSAIHLENMLTLARAGATIAATEALSRTNEQDGPVSIPPGSVPPLVQNVPRGSSRATPRGWRWGRQPMPNRWPTCRKNWD